MPPLVAVFQHAPTEGPGTIASWLSLQGASLEPVEWWKPEASSCDPSRFDACVVLGGAMNIYQHRDYPWLVAEKQKISRFLETGTPVLGICLGAQLLADCLGAKVTQNPFQEIGWWPLRFSDAARTLFPDLPQEQTLFHWHGDSFSLPDGASRLASSDACPEQGFLYKNTTLALQFHPEVTPEMLPSFCGEDETSKPSGPWVQTNESILSLSPSLCPPLSPLLDSLLRPFFAPIFSS